MAYVKMTPIYKTIQKAIDYTSENEKTEMGIYITRFNCIRGKEKEAFLESLYQNGTFNRGKKSKKNVLSHHIVQSFKGDEVTMEQAHQIGKQLIEEVFENKYRVIISTHGDKKNIHNHILLCPVNLKTNKRYYGNKENIKTLRKVSDDLCRENKLSMINPDKNKEKKQKKGVGYYEYTQNAKRLGYKKQIEKIIDEIISSSRNYEEFLKDMAKTKCLVEESKSGKIKFKLKGRERFVRGKTIGEDYTKERIKERIEEGNKISSWERDQRLREKWGKTEEKSSFNYNWTEINKTKEKIKSQKKNTTFREVLKEYIEIGIEKSKSYEEFISFMREEGYEVKTKKNLAFKGKGQEKYIWAKSLGKEYSEWEIRKNIKNKEKVSQERKLIDIERAEKKGENYSNWAIIENMQRAINAYHVIESCEENVMNIEKDLIEMEAKIEGNNELILAMQREIERQRNLLNAINEFIYMKNKGELHGEFDVVELMKENGINDENAEVYFARTKEYIQSLQDKQMELKGETKLLKENQKEIKESINLLKDYIVEGKKEKRQEALNLERDIEVISQERKRGKAR